MLQGSDPFDEFRTKKEIERLETDFQATARKKRKRLKELLDGDDGGDPDGVAKRVQDEMESFFLDSAQAAETVFKEVGADGEGCTQEIQQCIDEVLRPVDAPPASLDEAKTPESVEDALARIRRHEDDAVPAEGDVAAAMPDWLDVTEETIDESEGPAEVPEDRRERILGAFDASAGRFRELLRGGLSDDPGPDLDDGPSDEPPLSRRAEGEGFVATQTRTAVAVEEAAVPMSLQARVEVLEEEVARLSRALAKIGLVEDETA